MWSRSAGKTLLVIVRRHDLDLLRLRTKNADDQILAGTMRAENAERIGVGTVQEGGDLVRIDRVDGK